jgi:tRNA-binding EMAP/Myf-like protein
MKDLIEFSEFIEIQKKLEIKIGQIINVEDVPKSNKLIKLTVDFGTETRIVVTNIKPLLNLKDSHIQANLRGTLGIAVSLDDKGHQALLNKKLAFITNLKPVTMMGIESTAMIMPGEIEKGNVITMQGELGTILL